MTARYQHSSATPLTPQAPLALPSAIASYLLHHAAICSRPKTIAWHTHCLGQWQAYCTAQALETMSDLTLDHLQRWVVQLQRTTTAGKNRTGRTISWYVRSLRAFWRWCLRRGYVSEDLVAWLELPRVDRPLIRIIEPDDFTHIVEVARSSSADLLAQRNVAILWVLYDAGIRLSELTGLRLGDYDTGRDLILVRGKGQKERRIALGHHAAYVLQRYVTEIRSQFRFATKLPHLFLTDEGSLSPHGVQVMLRRLRTAAGLESRRLNPHLFRHSFAVRFLLLGGDVFTLQQLLGHEDMATIKNYMHLADVHIQAQKRKFSPGDEIALPRRSRSPRSTRQAVRE